MAKVRIPKGMTLEELVAELAAIGITVDRHPLPDGAYRCYVPKSKINEFINNLNQLDYGQKQNLQNRGNDRDGDIDVPGDCFRADEL